MSKKIHKILACVDLSKYSLTTFEYALELAGMTAAKVLVLNVINQADINGVEMVNGYFPGYFSKKINAAEYVTALRKERRKSLNELIENHSADDRSLMTIKIDTGTPSECILETIETENIDLVVMANKGRGNLSRFLFGSTAEKVFRHSSIPVVSVRQKVDFKRGK